MKKTIYAMRTLCTLGFTVAGIDTMCRFISYEIVRGTLWFIITLVWLFMAIHWWREEIEE